MPSRRRGYTKRPSVLFYPKFHCEINFIEYLWGAAKRYTRNNCGSNIKASRKLIPKALDFVSEQQIWKYANKVERILNAYRDEVEYDSKDFLATI